MSDIIARKYFENMPYGKDAKSSEIHGKQNQQVINGMITGLVAKYDEAMASGDKGSASNYAGVVKSIAKDLANPSNPPLEFSIAVKSLSLKAVASPSIAGASLATI